MIRKLTVAAITFLLVFAVQALGQKRLVYFCGSENNDLYVLLKQEGYAIKRFEYPQQAVANASNGGAVIIVSDSYPVVDKNNELDDTVLSLSKKKGLKLYVEYVSKFPGIDISPEPVITLLERGVVTSDLFGGKLKKMSIIGIHNCHVLPAVATDPLMVLARVVGVDKAEYGLDSTKTYPLLFRKDNVLVSTTCLSNFAKSRYGPNESVKQLWTYILSDLTGNKSLKLKSWVSNVSPMYGKGDVLPSNATAKSIEKGIQWFYKGRFFVHPDWNDFWTKYKIQGDGTAPFGPPVNQSWPNGDGSLGILEGHASEINYDGTQQYRYWMRTDVQGEAAMALAAAGDFLKVKDYNQKADNLVDYIFEHSNVRKGAKGDSSSAVYGMIGWATTFSKTFYGDDNARTILGALATASYLQTDKWDKQLTEAILGNFRITSKQGFAGDRHEEKNIIKNGWQYYWNRDYIYPSAHFESWMWACYLWLYDKTKYEPLLEKTKSAIKIMMETYPKKWLWGSSFQTQRARMILPLAWLVRVDDTDEHRRWLDLMITDLLKNQDTSGALREEIGEGKGHFKQLKSNNDYGTDEGSLIYSNGDPVADMLYTNNFALFSLNEAYHATGNIKYQEAVSRLSDFLTRIQIKSDKFPDLDGAWFRAFDFKRWDYWASNSDWGWGAWCTLTGWCQSWIVATQVQIMQKQSYWDVTKTSKIGKYLQPTVNVMFK